MNKLLIITWISGSWKTTLQDELLSRWWVRPINFTTRKPRSDEELDEYVFLNTEQYFSKMKNWDFLESTNYNGNWYWVSSHLQEWDVCIVLDPIGREQALEKMTRLLPNLKPVCIYLDLSSDKQIDRLRKRWDSDEQIKARQRDFKWFSPSKSSHCLDANLETKKLADDICEIFKKT